MGVLQVVLRLTVLVMLMVGDNVGACSGCESASRRSLACCGRCWPACSLVLTVFIVFWSCGCWVTFLAERDIVGGGTAHVAAGFRCRLGLRCGVGVLCDAFL